MPLVLQPPPHPTPFYCDFVFVRRTRTLSCEISDWAYMYVNVCVVRAKHGDVTPLLRWSNVRELPCMCRAVHARYVSAVPGVRCGEHGAVLRRWSAPISE